MQIYKPNKPGRPSGTDKKLTKEIIDKISNSFEQTLIYKHAALLAGETPYHLKKWLKEGQADAQNCIDSLNAQLFFKVGKTLAEKVSSYISRIEYCPDNYRALTWLLEKGFKEDFGSQSEMIMELIDNIKVLATHKGDDDGEVDGESTQEAT